MFTFIPESTEMVTTFDIQNVINQSMKAPCEHRTDHKTLHL